MKKEGLVMALFHDEETERTRAWYGYGRWRRHSSAISSGSPGISGSVVSFFFFLLLLGCFFFSASRTAIEELGGSDERKKW